MSRATFALAALALAVVGTLVVPSAAVPVLDDATDEGDGDRVHDDIVITPHAGPNGDYAVMDDGEIELRFDAANPKVEGKGVNAGTVTPFDRVFSITYDGEESATVWVTDEREAITFYRGSDPTATLEDADDGVELEPDESVAVGVLVDATDAEAVEGYDSFSIRADLVESDDEDEPKSSEPDDEDDSESTEPDDGDRSAVSKEPENAAEIGVTKATVEPSSVAPNETVSVKAIVENEGLTNGTETLALTVDGETVATREVTVPWGESRTVQFETTFTNPGTYVLGVEDVTAGTVTVESQSATDGGRSDSDRSGPDTPTDTRSPEFGQTDSDTRTDPPGAGAVSDGNSSDTDRAETDGSGAPNRSGRWVPTAVTLVVGSGLALAVLYRRRVG